MLRLQRKPFHKEVILVWNRGLGEEKKSFFWPAMAYAFFVHVMGACLVTIRLLQPMHSVGSIPPVSAAAYTEEDDGGTAIADETEGGRQQRHWGIPSAAAAPQLPLPRPPQRYYPITPKLPQENSSELFAVLEDFSLPCEEENKPFLRDKSLVVRICGELTQHPLRNRPWKRKVFSVQEPMRLAFHVLVEGKTGEIIWYEAIELTKEPLLIKEIEGLLRQTKFSIEGDSAFVEGEIEFLLKPAGGIGASRQGLDPCFLKMH